MSKLWIAVGLFLVFGGLLIYQQASDPKLFTAQYVSWLGRVFGNVEGVTSHAVTDYTWLPPTNQTPSVKRPAKNAT